MTIDNNDDNYNNDSNHDDDNISNDKNDNNDNNENNDDVINKRIKRLNEEYSRRFEKLKQEKLFDLDFYELFNCGQNLIIKPDFEDFTFLGKKEDINTERRFKNIFLRFINELFEELPDRKNDIDILVENINEDDFRTKKFKILFDEIISECDEESKYHKIKENYQDIYFFIKSIF